MKKTILLITLLAIQTAVISQVITEQAKKKFTIGFDLYTDIWMDQPQGIKVRTINQGANVFGTFNFQLGSDKSKVYFALGLGIRSHNMYSNSRILDVNADTIVMTPLEPGQNYRKSKINFTYFDVPIEFKFRGDKGLKVGIGFKLGLLLDSKTKYYGDEQVGGPGIRIKEKRINQLERYTYGPTLRIGYKAINLFGYYQLSPFFIQDKGPQMYPISVGITLTPF